MSKKEKNTNVSLPTDMLNEIDKYIELFPEYGYTSRVDVIREGMREWIKEKKKEEQMLNLKTPGKKD